ncbi:hypothetical protein Asppvi_001559 [Aspergillus pseudoviridinutans]|uniref:Uncharacterized protein n=1 Tax=Aspergillus pseudoviridinutans TaxID=1517512 RepID=A0A9P3B2R4_9EURO|nr:uncharacterized protein Asppvi_001559 [Aspergillus pseudoviridinutans]GIJ83042.1 hypothetical protein Asppvi_001559 [Aspergillus pseudoviridinutans]
MGIPNYGVWVAYPTHYRAQTEEEDPRTPHIYLYFTDGTSTRQYQAAINVKSTDRDTRLVFWFDRAFSHSITQTLSDLDGGFTLLNRDGMKGLDYIRTEGLVDIKAGKVLPHDIPGPNNDILDSLDPILSDAIAQKARMYVFGSSFGTGLHDVHMNQGSLPQFENGVYEDGALLFEFEDGHWEAVFLAFASQRIRTDETGEAVEGSPNLAKILGADSDSRQ